jgi:chaperonin GroES
MDLKPLGDRVIVKQLEAVEQTAGGLYVSSGAAEKPTEGIVIAVGAGKVDENGVKVTSPVEVGDKVIFGKFGGTNIKLGGEELQILRFDDLYAVYE